MYELLPKGSRSYKWTTPKRFEEGVLFMSIKNQSLNEKNLWEAWLTERDSDAANRLIKKYMYLVTFHVERMKSTLPSTVCRDDLTSFGLIGLFDAMKKFDLDRKLKFDTYASFRIRGAMIDGLRKEDWLPRSLREKTKKIEQASQTLEQQLQREPSSCEIAAHLDMTSEEVETVIQDSIFSNIWSLEDKPKGNIESSKEGIGYLLEDDDAIQPEELIIQEELEEDLVQSLKMLNKNEQLVISLFYKEELTFTEVGKILGLTTSRISQIHKKAIFKLKNKLEKIQSATSTG